MNLTMGIRIANYGLMLLASVLGFGIALKQVFLHLTPGDVGYGTPLLGLYLYTWSAIVFVTIIVLSASSFLLEKAFVEPSSPPGRFIYLLMFCFLALIIANGISTFLECGASNCKDNPVNYYLLETTG